MQRVAQLERPVALDSTEDDLVVTASANLLQSVDTKASDSRTQKVAPLEGENMASYLKRRDEEPAKSDLDVMVSPAARLVTTSSLSRFPSQRVNARYRDKVIDSNLQIKQLDKRIRKEQAKLERDVAR
jgi:predicted nucleotidyltransferase